MIYKSWNIVCDLTRPYTFQDLPNSHHCGQHGAGRTEGVPGKLRGPLWTPGYQTLHQIQVNIFSSSTSCWTSKKLSDKMNFIAGLSLKARLSEIFPVIRPT